MRILLFLLSLTLLSACKNDATTTSAAEKKAVRLVAGKADEPDMERRIRLVREWVINGKDSVHFHMLTNGEVSFEQSSQILIEDLGNETFRCTEFSGSFTEPGTDKTIYSGIDYILYAADSVDRRDSLIRPIREFKVIFSGAGTEVQQSGESCYALDEIRTLTAAGRKFRVYRLLGLENPIAAYVNHYKTGLALPASDNRYWVPEFGTVLTWYGNGTSFDLVRTANPDEEKVLKELLQVIRNTWEMK